MSTRTVSISGPLTFEHAAEHAKVLSGELENSHTLIVDIGDCDAIDLAGVQVLIAAFHSATAGGGNITYRNAQRYRSICEYAGIEPAGIEQP